MKLNRIWIGGGFLLTVLALCGCDSETSFSSSKDLQKAAVVAQFPNPVLSSSPLPLGSSSGPSGLTVNLHYQSPITYMAGVAISMNSPTFSGGAPTLFSVFPSLPEGLSLNETTGVISGTPRSLTPDADYVVTARNGAGSTMVAVNIAVSDSVMVTASGDGNEFISAGSVAVSKGLVGRFSVTPNAGFVLGIPTGTCPAGSFAGNVYSTGAITASCSVIFNAAFPQGPSNLSYTSPAVYTVRIGPVSNSPTVSGGVPTSYSVSPGLPPGLALNASTGLISGIPTVSASAADYTVTARNNVGSTTAKVNIQVTGSTSIGSTHNIVTFGDEWAARFTSVNGDSRWSTPNANGVSIQSNLTNFWNDCFSAITGNTNHSQKKILFAAFNTAERSWAVIPISSWRTYLPNLAAEYTLTEYTGTSLSLTSIVDSSNHTMADFDALIFVSTDSSNKLTATDLLNYSNSGHGIMTMLVGLPGTNECANMNNLLQNLPSIYDCSNTLNNFTFTGVFSNVTGDSSLFPFNNGNAVISNPNYVSR